MTKKLEAFSSLRASEAIQEYATLREMKPKRSKEHTTLTESSAEILRILEKIPGIKNISPGIIDAKRSGDRHVTAVYTTAGMILIISGQGVQKIAVHTHTDPRPIFATLKAHKRLKNYVFHERERK